MFHLSTLAQSLLLRSLRFAMLSYRELLSPWCIIRSFPNCRTVIVTRFRRRSDAEAQLHILHRLLPTVPLSIMFDGSIHRNNRK
jgi:hypothetical protein